MNAAYTVLILLFLLSIEAAAAAASITTGSINGNNLNVSRRKSRRGKGQQQLRRRTVLVSKNSNNTIIDLSLEFIPDHLYNENKDSDELLRFALDETGISGFIVVKNGKIVSEYYKADYNNDSNTIMDADSDNRFDIETKAFLWSVTKYVTGMIIGNMEYNDILSLNDTLGDVWPDLSIWYNKTINETIPLIRDADERRAISIESLLQLSSGLLMPPDWLVSCVYPFDLGICGGSNMIESIGWCDYDPLEKGSYNYLFASNLLSYVIKERSGGMSPESYALENIFPLLGITKDDYEWERNIDLVSYALHGLKMNVRSMAKLGMAFLQDGIINPHGDRIVSERYIKGATSSMHNDALLLGQEEVGFGYHLWIMEDFEKYCALGLGGQVICIDAKENTVIAIASNTIRNWVINEVAEKGGPAYHLLQLIFNNNMTFSEPSFTPSPTTFHSTTFNPTTKTPTINTTPDSTDTTSSPTTISPSYQSTSHRPITLGPTKSPEGIDTWLWIVIGIGTIIVLMEILLLLRVIMMKYFSLNNHVRRTDGNNNNCANSNFGVSNCNQNDTASHCGGTSAPQALPYTDDTPYCRHNMSTIDLRKKPSIGLVCQPIQPSRK